ncbi:hypothetical protein LCGC14_1886970 [marine sediment metagenome]|uniref:Uncharacterized protein n=1 Tax=marine sediment metagenome TaxID=412755 RepID=A0A0F9G0J7_9ZZZZ
MCEECHRQDQIDRWLEAVRNYDGKFNIYKSLTVSFPQSETVKFVKNFY